MNPHGKILIVDDNLINREIMREILEGYLLKLVVNGEEALAEASRFRPDLILLDIMPPQ